MTKWFAGVVALVAAFILVPPAVAQSGHEKSGTPATLTDADVFVETPTRGTVYRQGGMSIDPVSPTEATGIVHLKNDPGRYEDVYVKGPAGWRFKSRTYLPTDPAPTFQPRPRQSGR